MVNTDKNINYFINLITFVGISAIIIFTFWAYENDLFYSLDAFRQFISKFGIYGPLIFIIVQIIQVIVPIAPGGVSCVAGIFMFGGLTGFICNYVGICIGSIIVFIISRRFGNQFVKSIIGAKNYHKYNEWIDKDESFTKMFAIAIFFPVAPDDLLCYIAGLTKMKLKTFIAIILAGKPLSIAAYSLGLATAISQMINLLF